MFTGCPVVIRSMSLHRLGRGISNHCYSRQSHQLATHGREGVRFLSHSKPPPRGGPPAGGSLARTWERSSFAPKAAFDSATWTRASASRLRRLRLDVNAARVSRSSAAARATAICCATSICTSWARRYARPARRSSNVSGAPQRFGGVTHGHSLVLSLPAMATGPSPGATPGSPVPHAAGQALPVRHRRKTAEQIHIAARGVFLPVESTSPSAGRWVIHDRANVLSISILTALTATVAAAKVTMRLRPAF